MTQQKNKNTKNVLYSDKRLNKSFPKKKINEILLKKYLEQLSKFCEVKIFPHKAFENEKIFVSMNDVAVTDIMDCICGLFYTTWEKRGNGYILMPYTPGLQNHIPKSIHQKRSMEILNEFQELYTNAPKSLQNNLYFDENRGTKMLFEDLPKPLQDKISQFSENHLQVLSENRKPSNATTSLLENLKGSHIGFRVTNPNQRISQMELGIKKDNAFISVSMPNVIGEIKNQKSRKNDSSSYSCDSGHLTKEELREKEIKDERLNRKISIHLNQASHPRLLLEISRLLPDMNFMTYIPMRSDEVGPFHFSNVPLKTILNEATPKFRYQKWEMRRSGHIFIGINYIPDKEL